MMLKLIMVMNLHFYTLQQFFTEKPFVIPMEVWPDRVKQLFLGLSINSVRNHTTVSLTVQLDYSECLNIKIWQHNHNSFCTFSLIDRVF